MVRFVKLKQCRKGYFRESEPLTQRHRHMQEQRLHMEGMEAHRGLGSTWKGTDSPHPGESSAGSSPALPSSP